MVKLIKFDDYNSINLCKFCQIMIWDPLPKMINIGDDYEDLELKTFFNYLKNIRVKQYSKDLETIKQLVPPGGHILDVGCAQGWFVNIANSKGFNSDGIEPSKTLIPFAKKVNPNSQIIQGDFLKTNIIHKYYDAITFWSVLEHTIDPVRVVKKANKILKTNGILCIRVPNSDGLIPKLIIFIHKLSAGIINGPSKSLFQFSCHYKHFFMFNIKSLKLLLNKTGFSVVHYYTNPSFDINNFEKRVSSSKNTDLKWAKFPLLLYLVKIFVNLANKLNLNDEIVIFAKKN